jgi:hypothetical protein
MHSNFTVLIMVKNRKLWKNSNNNWRITIDPRWSRSCYRFSWSLTKQRIEKISWLRNYINDNKNGSLKEPDYRSLSPDNNKKSRSCSLLNWGRYKLPPMSPRSNLTLTLDSRVITTDLRKCMSPSSYNNKADFNPEPLSRNIKMTSALRADRWPQDTIHNHLPTLRYLERILAGIPI